MPEFKAHFKSEQPALSGSLPGDLIFCIPGKDGGYYLVAAEQTDANTIRFTFTPSQKEMPAVDPVDITLPNATGAGLTTAQINALDGMFKVCAFTKPDVSAEYNAFKNAFGIGGEVDPDVPDVPDVPDEPDVPEKTLTSISVVYSGGSVAAGTAVSELTGIVVTAHYSDGTSETVTGYTLSGTIAEGSNTITVSFGGKTTTFTITGVAESGGDEPTIPAEYQQVEYIEFDGNSRIVTDETGADNFRYTAEVAFPVATSEQCIMTLAASAMGGTNVGFTTTEGRIFFYTGNDDDTVDVTDVPNLNTSKVAIDASFKLDVGRSLAVKVDGETYTSTGSANGSINPGYKFVVGNGATGSKKYGYIGKIYSASYYTNDVLACALIPCYRKSDGVIGMYDNVSGKFYTNGGNGTFTKGADVA